MDIVKNINIQYIRHVSCDFSGPMIYSSCYEYDSYQAECSDLDDKTILCEGKVDNPQEEYSFKTVYSKQHGVFDLFSESTWSAISEEKNFTKSQWGHKKSIFELKVDYKKMLASAYAETIGEQNEVLEKFDGTMNLHDRHSPHQYSGNYQIEGHLGKMDVAFQYFP